MPEGDTLYRVAARIHAAAAGQVVRRVTAPDPRIILDGIAGSTLAQSESRGKHLLLHFDSGFSVHAHLGMTGSWHVYPTDARWHRPARQASIALEFDQVVAAGFSLPLLRVMRRQRIERDPLLARLGPDVLAEDFDPVTAARHVATDPRLAVGEALLNQRLVSGLGNVYKSELLFLAGLHPTEPVGTISQAELARLLAAASRAMRRNLTVARRRFRHTTYGGRLWVYRRADRPCYHCGTAIAILRQGEALRSSYFCPDCQPRRTVRQPAAADA